MHTDVPQQLDFPTLEKEMLTFWEEKQIFKKLCEKNKNSGKKFRFVDGPITANNPMGVHHAWGRTYKDVFHRYKAMQGYHARYQNGFDCQGLWVEVEVEKELGFKSKKDIEAFGVDKFVNKCKERVYKYSAQQTKQSIRLGYWMDWENSYYTMSPENNYTIWHFLQKCHEHGWIYRGTDVMPWCHRCGTALSNMEIATEGYKDIVHRCVFLQLPIVERPGEYLLVWTTTPWTLTANVAVAVHPDLDYLKVKQGEKIYYVTKGRKEILKGEYENLAEIKGNELNNLHYKAPFGELAAQNDVSHRVVLWKDVSDTDGTGMVHIAPGCGKEDFALGKEQNLAVIAPLDESGIYLEGFGHYTGKKVSDVSTPIINELKEKGVLYYSHDYKHRYPTCWRCSSELVFRLVDEWFISMDELRPQIMEVVKTAKWIPEFGLDRELDWLKNMGDWCISKKRYWGLALPIFVCESCNNFDVVGGYKDLQKHAASGWEKFEGHTPHRPWIDEVKTTCSKCGGTAKRIKDVANPWLDAGIVPYSTIIPNEDCYTPEKEANGKWKFNPDSVYPARTDFWKEWFPAELITECFPGQFRNWFYAILTMSTVLENKTPFEALLGHALVKDEKGDDMHKSKGNAIWFDDAADKIGADLMRWIYCAQNCSTDLNFGYNMAGEFKRSLLTLHNVYSFYITYAKLDNYSPVGKNAENEKLQLIDKWILSELHTLIKEVRSAIDAWDLATPCKKIYAFIDTLSTWYVRRSRRRFWKSEDDGDKNAAYYTLYHCLFTTIKLLAPIMPFWTEKMYQNLVRGIDTNAPISIHLCDYPVVEEQLIDLSLQKNMDLVRTVVSLGHAARKEAKCKVRQPLSCLKFKGATKEEWEVVKSYEDVIKDEINVKTIEELKSLDGLLAYKTKANFAKLGPKFGTNVKAVAAKISELTSEQAKFLKESGFIKCDVAGLGEVEVLLGEAEVSSTSLTSLLVKVEKNLAVALDTSLSQDLLHEGLVREFIHRIQNERKDAGFEVQDKIIINYKGTSELEKVIGAYASLIKQETLATEIGLNSDLQSEEIDINGLKLSLKLTKV